MFIIANLGKAGLRRQSLLPRGLCHGVALIFAAHAGTPAFAADVDDILVTANRREQAATSVPVSLVALSRDRLDQDRIQNINDLTRATPTLALRGAWGGTQKIAVRGIASSTGSSTTGIYIDDTPIHTRALGSADVFANVYPEIFDIERIEVLRGPQGTLFGSGSEGGTVRFITNAPSLDKTEVYARGSVSATEHGEPSGQLGASLSTPLVQERIGLSVTAFQKREGGWIDRRPFGTAGTPDDNVNRRDTTSLRSALAVKLTPDITATPGIFYQRTYRHDTDQYWERLSDPDAGRFVTGEAVKQSARDKFVLPSLKLEADLGSAKLISNTAWFDRSNNTVVDYTFHSVEGLTRGAFILPPGVPDYQAPVDFESHQHSFTQEVRLQSAATGSPLNWTVGLFYQNSRQNIEQRINDPQLASFTAILGGTPQQVFGVGLLPGNLSFQSFDRSVDKQYAAFAEAEWEVVKRLTVTFGARQSLSRISSANRQDGPYNFGPSASQSKVRDNSFTPRAVVSYRLNDMGMVYASATKGFRPGGGNFSVPKLFCAGDLAALGLSDVPAEYKSDHLWSYEVGAKASRRGVKAQASAFYTDWRNIQQSVPLITCGTSYVANLGRAVSKGVDAQLEVQPLNGLTLRGSFSYIDAKFTRTLMSGPAGGLLVSNGDKLPVPAWQARASSAYSFPVGGHDAFVQFDYDYAGGYQRVPSAPAQGYDPGNPHANAIHYAGLRGGVELGAWRLETFIDNLFNSTDPIFRTHDSVFATIYRQQGFRPRTFGLQFIYRM